MPSMIIPKHLRILTILVFVILVFPWLSSCARKISYRESPKLEDLNLRAPKGTVLLARVYATGAEELQLLTFEKRKIEGNNLEVGPFVSLGKEKFYPTFKRLQSGFIGKLTKDLQRIYFIERGNLYSGMIKSGERRLLSKLGEVVFLTLSPDEKKVAFLCNGKNDIYVYDVEKNKVKTFSSLLEPRDNEEGFPPVYHLEWLNREKIIYSCSDLVVLDIETGETKPLTETKDVYEAYFSLSPQRETLIFYDYKSYGLFFLDLKKKKVSRVKKVSKYMGIPYPFTWTPDGKTVAFEIGGEDVGFFEIWLLSVEKREVLKRLRGERGKFLFTPYISPDGRWLIYQEWAKVGESGEVSKKDKDVYLFLSPLKNLDKKIVLFKTTFPDNGFRPLDWKR